MTMNKFQLTKHKKIKLVKDLIDFIMELPTLLLVVKCVYALHPRTRPDLPDYALLQLELKMLCPKNKPDLKSCHDLYRH